MTNFFAKFVERWKAGKKLRIGDKKHNLALELIWLQSQIKSARSNKPRLAERLERERTMVQRQLDRLCSRG